MKYRIYKVNLIGQVNNAATDYRRKTSDEDKRFSDSEDLYNNFNPYFDYLDERDAKKKADELNNRTEHPDIEYWYRVAED